MNVIIESMKFTKHKSLTFFALCMLFSGLLFGQVPEKVSYQSIIRDASGDIVRSQEVGMQISILQGSTSGTVVYVETHTPTTNINGLASVEIGDGTSSDTFSDIDWSDGPYFLKVETDPSGGTSYSISGTTEILSVPYAMHAKSVKGILDADNNVVSNVADPVDEQDAATKAYVDVLEEKITKLENTNKAGGGIIDERDGNYYNTLKIGDQVWMAENLAYLPSVSSWEDGSEDGEGTESYYYVYDYEGSSVSAAKATENYETYGVLYNWPAATTACPSGWHLPTDAEWTILTDYLTDNGYGYEGSGSDIAKALAATKLWNYYSGIGTVGNGLALNNSSGFDALPGGCRLSIYFQNVGYSGYWWSATEDTSSKAWLLYLGYCNIYVYRVSNNREFGFSVRCVRD